MEFRDKQSIYLQIADHFIDNILLKIWKPEDRIPSVREVAVMVEVNPNTVMRTFTYLQEKGVIYNKRGIGYFVSPGAFNIAHEIKKEAFIENELPLVFKTMDMLHFTLDDLKNLYQQSKKVSEKE
ncbi:MAG: GntR family transcriptional regulator [Bacteroidota bacterium]|nr:GntR family transcriptional regulator [Bacteroidota bacterium]MDP4274058.1 GntR family transcriptional regulator [Bacteroidota bacterium]